MERNHLVFCFINLVGFDRELHGSQPTSLAIRLHPWVQIPVYFSCYCRVLGILYYGFLTGELV